MPPKAAYPHRTDTLVGEAFGKQSGEKWTKAVNCGLQEHWAESEERVLDSWAAAMVPWGG